MLTQHTIDTIQLALGSDYKVSLANADEEIITIVSDSESLVLKGSAELQDFFELVIGKLDGVLAA